MQLLLYIFCLFYVSCIFLCRGPYSLTTTLLESYFVISWASRLYVVGYTFYLVFSSRPHRADVTLKRTSHNRQQPLVGSLLQNRSGSAVRASLQNRSGSQANVRQSENHRHPRSMGAWAPYANQMSVSFKLSSVGMAQSVLAFFNGRL